MIIDYIKSSLSNIKRNKKNKILIIIFVLLLFLLFVDTIIIKNFYSYYDYAINKNIGFRTLSVDYNDMTHEEAIAELSNIDHVVEVYEGTYNSTGVHSNINDNGLNGIIGLIYGTSNTAPPSIKGKNISELRRGELICPDEFYPDSRYGNPLDIDESKFLSEDKILNRDVTITYYRYNQDIVDNKVVETKEEKTQNMKIVGLYDREVFQNAINECYATKEDIKDIVVYQNPFLEEYNYSGFRVIVDTKENLDEVINKIKINNKFMISDTTISNIDQGPVTILFTVTSIFAFAIIFSIAFILKNYISKKVKNESAYLGILRSCGYTKSQVILKEIIENTIVLFISFIISASIFIIIFAILENRIFRYFKYIGFNISNNIAVLFIDFLVVLIISELINYFVVRKRINQPISDILKED